MSKLSSGQLFTLFLVSSAFSLMCSQISYSLEAALGTLLGTAVQAVLILPMLLLYTRRPFSFSEYARGKRVLPLLFVLYGVLLGSRSLVQLWEAAGSTNLSGIGALPGTALIVAVCLYTSSLGIKALGRSSAVMFGIFLVMLAILLLGAVSNFRPEYLVRSRSSALLQSTLYAAGNFDLLPLLFVVLDLVPKRRAAAVYGYLFGSLLLTLLVMLLSMGVLGPLMQQSSVPFFWMTAVSQPMQTQRSDALYLLVFVLLCVIRMTLITALCAHLLGFAFPKLQGRSTICLSVIALLAALTARLQRDSCVWYALLPLVLTAAVPIGLWFRMGNLQKFGKTGKGELG